MTVHVPEAFIAKPTCVRVRNAECWQGSESEGAGAQADDVAAEQKEQVSQIKEKLKVAVVTAGDEIRICVPSSIFRHLKSSSSACHLQNGSNFRH